MTFVLYAQVEGRGTPFHHILTTEDQAWLDANRAMFLEAGVTTRVETIRPRKKR